MRREEDSLDELRQEYCPPLDEAVFYAIASDYDLNQPTDVQSFKATLEPLRTSAVEQENTDFDPSGTGGFSHTQTSSEDQLQTSSSSPDEASTSNGMRSITTGLSELQWDDETTHGAELEAMSDEGKKTWLQNTFTEIPPFQVAYTLKKCNGQVNKALDELLTLNTLEEAKERDGEYLGRVPKGIDGFIAEENGDRGRKRKTRKSRTTESSRASSTTSTMSEAPTGRRNVWTAAEEEVEFLISRANVPPAKCRAAYHANQASLGATVRALAGQYTRKFRTLNEIDPLVQLSLADLQTEFPSVPQAELYGVLTLARNMPSAARELVESLMSPARTESVNLSGAVTYAPFELTSDSSPSTARSASLWSAVDPTHGRNTAAAHGAAAGIAFSQASAAYRRSKSDRLMGGAAAYYSEVGRERALAAKASSAQAAAALVGSQSSATVLDLHGISVADAVRIASDRVNAWWDTLGDAKYAPGGGGPARDGYRVVYGVGRHSRDGAPRLGPAVSRMLIREGWKVEVGHGESIVYGKARALMIEHFRIWFALHVEELSDCICHGSGWPAFWTSVAKEMYRELDFMVQPSIWFTQRFVIPYQPQRRHPANLFERRSMT